MATPGAGKTFMAITIARNLIEEGYIDMFVVVTPYVNLREQWVQDASYLGCELDTEFRVEIPGRGIVMPGDGEYDGLVTSYQQIARGAYEEAFRYLCHKRKVLVILDEPHHCGESKNWADSLIGAFSLAKYKLSITGTPFRTDEKFIPFLDYERDLDEDGVEKWKAKMDYTYSYADALQEEYDKVVRPVEFPKFDGEVTWIEKVAEEMEDGLFSWSQEPITITKTFEEKVSIQEARTRLNAALMSEGGWINAILEAANEKLTEIREWEQSDAGGIAFTRDIKHAREIALVLQKITGEMPTIITHDEDDNSFDIIRDHTNSSKRWIVSVKMISEGVNIKRLRVGVYITNVTTRMYFIQTLGRIQRYQDEVEEPQHAYFYVPRVEPFLTYIKEIYQAISHVIISKEGEQRTVNGNPLSQRWIEYDKTIGWERDRDFGGDNFTYEEILEGRLLIQRAGMQGRISDSEAAMILRQANIIKQPDNRKQEDTSKANKETKRDRVKRLRKECNRLVGLLVAYSVNEKNTNEPVEYAEVHGAWANKYNGSKHETATENSLLQKMDWLQTHIVSAKAGKFKRSALWK